MTTSEVSLRNGVAVPDVAVGVVMVNLRHLMAEQPVAFYELVSVCRDREHELWPGTGEILRKMSMLESDGQPHQLIRDIVLSAVTGEGFDLHLNSPLADERDA